MIEGYLTKDYAGLFDGTEACATKIVLSTPQTFARRHGPKAAQRAGYATEATWTEWDRCLTNCFDLVIVDEAHELSNKKTEQVNAIKMLKAEMRLAVTATPMGFEPKHFADLLSWLQPPAWNGMTLGAINKVYQLGAPMNNIWKSLPDDHPATALFCTERAVQIGVNHVDIDVATGGERLARIFKQILIKRTQTSNIMINGTEVSIASDLKPLKIDNVELQYQPSESTKYQDILQGVLKVSKNKKSLRIDGNSYRKLSLLDSWVGFEHLIQYKAKVRIIRYQVKYLTN